MSLHVDITKDFGAFTLDVAFDTERELLALLGASGCGKSMTLQCIAGLVTPDCGRIVLNDRVLFDSVKKINLPPQKRRVGYLFQNYALFPNMTVAQNLAAGCRGLPRARRPSAMSEKIRAFRLGGLEDLYPRQLSGGQQQRVALARVLISEPEALLLDEPFSALDDYLKWQTELELGEALRAYGGDAVFVSHSRGEVYRLCDSVCVLTDGKSEDKIGVRSLMDAPGTVGAALISGCKNFSSIRKIDATHVECLDWGVTLETSQEIARGATCAGVRAHSFHIAAAGEPNRFGCRVARVIDDTFSTILMLAPDMGRALIRVEMPKEDWAAMRCPDMVPLAVAPENVMILTGEL